MWETQAETGEHRQNEQIGKDEGEGGKTRRKQASKKERSSGISKRSRKRWNYIQSWRTNCRTRHGHADRNRNARMVSLPRLVPPTSHPGSQTTYLLFIFTGRHDVIVTMTIFKYILAAYSVSSSYYLAMSCVFVAVLNKDKAMRQVSTYAAECVLRGNTGVRQ